MTNKTEMVSDAELDELEVAEALLVQQGFSNLAAAISVAYTFIKETRAAPAVDVRAVVDESVAGPNWQACWTDWLTHHAGTDPDGFERHWNGWKAALHANINPQ